jgi:hypothetical protein
VFRFSNIGKSIIGKIDCALKNSFRFILSI